MLVSPSLFLRQQKWSHLPFWWQNFLVKIFRCPFIPLTHPYPLRTQGDLWTRSWMERVILVPSCRGPSLWGPYAHARPLTPRRLQHKADIPTCLPTGRTWGDWYNWPQKISLHSIHHCQVIIKVLILTLIYDNIITWRQIRAAATTQHWSQHSGDDIMSTRKCLSRARHYARHMHINLFDPPNNPIRRVPLSPWFYRRGNRGTKD